MYFGSALTGNGVADVIDGVSRYLPARRARVDEPLQASVFKIKRDPAGHKVAFARLHSGTLTARDHVVYHHRPTAGVLAKREGRPTSVRTFTNGTATAADPALAGETTPPPPRAPRPTARGRGLAASDQYVLMMSGRLSR